MKYIFIFIGFIGGVVFGAVLPEDTSSKEFVLPDSIKACNRNDPDLNKCIKDTFQQQIPLLHKGSTLLKIAPLDPFEIPNNRFEYSNGAFGGTIIIKNVKIYGLSRTIIKKVRTKITDDGLTAEFDIFVPRLYVEGNYKADINFNDIKMRPKGYFNATLSDIGNTAKIRGIFKNIKDQKHLQLTEFDIDPEIGDMKLFATGIFPDPALNTLILDFANQHWSEFYKIVLPETKTHWEPLVLGNANQFLSLVPFDKLLLN